MVDTGQKFEVKECIRMTSVGCASQPQANALAFLKSNDLRSFTDVINNPDVEANADDKHHWINQPTDDAGSTLLELAIVLDRTKFVEHLVLAGARVDIISTASGYAPPHLAAERGNLALLQLLYKDRDACDVNIRSAEFKRGYSPLHLASEKGAVDCIKYLLSFEETDVDCKDLKGDTTPLLLAAKAKHEKAIVLLIENGSNLDIKAGRGTLREYINQTFPNLDLSRITVKKSRKLMLDLKDRVFKLLKETELSDSDYKSKLANFKTYMRFIRTLKDKNELDDIFDLACDKGLYDHVEIMLRKGADPNIASKPVLEAAYHGHYRVLRSLKNHNVILEAITTTKETVFHLILKKQSDSGSSEDYRRCLDVLLDKSSPSLAVDQLRNIINKKDDRGNTALHYATQKWSQATVRQLLDLGANIGIKNFWDEIPISKIRPDTMETFLNESCLKSSGDVVHENFSLTFKYDFLAPSIDSLPEKYKQDTEDPEDQQNLIHSKEHSKNGTNTALPETEPLWHMSQSKEHRHLLKHPVITSFLWYKWQRIRRYFNRNLRFFTLFVYLLTWHIFLQFGGNKQIKQFDLVCYSFYILLSFGMFFFIVKDWTLDVKDYQRNQILRNSDTKQDRSCFLLANLLLSNWIEVIFIGLLIVLLIFGSVVLKPLLAGLLILFVLREVFQIFVSVKRYFSSIENWIEIGIITLTSIILLQGNSDSSKELNKHLAAISIVLSWAELIVLIGRHPKLKEYNIYVTMFLKVLKTFLLFFTWYCLFIIAFGLGFFILLHKDSDESMTASSVGETNSNKKEEYVFFNTVWLSLIKTTTMFTGELEFSDIPIDLESTLAPLAYVYFISFVFLIVVVLSNLLNGLAVSDTGLIRDKAEIFSYRSQVETISTFESMLLGDPFDFLSNVPAMLSNLPSCSLFRQLYRNKSLRTIFTKIGASEILLFYKFFPDRSVTIWPNKRTDDCCCLSVDEIGKNIVTAAKEIIINKQTTLHTDRDEDISEKIDNLQTNVDNKIGKLENDIANMEAKMDLILRKLNKYGN